MRIVMPLFEYESTGIDNYTFITFPFSIERLKDEDIIVTELFSDQDIWHMKQEEWCLVFDGDDITDYVENSNLLLMAFRVSASC